MYFPFLRGKQFELETLLGLPTGIFANVVPIVEPVNIPTRQFYQRIAQNSIPLMIIVNPFYPASARVTQPAIQTLITTSLAGHTSLRIAYLIDSRYTIAGLNQFFASFPNFQKSLIFRHNPLAADLININALLAGNNQIEFLIFDETKTSMATRTAFALYPNRVLLTDGFQRQESNVNYPPVSAFASHYGTFRGDGLVGIGDYLTVGDNFQIGGGQVYVVALHVTKETSQGLVVHHFLSTSQRNIQGFGGQKFTEANDLLVTSPEIIPLNSAGLVLFRDWHNRRHNPQLGAAKKASMMHHIETISGIV